MVTSDEVHVSSAATSPTQATCTVGTSPAWFQQVKAPVSWFPSAHCKATQEEPPKAARMSLAETVLPTLLVIMAGVPKVCRTLMAVW